MGVRTIKLQKETTAKAANADKLREATEKKNCIWNSKNKMERSNVYKNDLYPTLK